MLVAGDEHDLSSKTSPELYKGCLAVGPPGRWDLIARKDNFFGLLDSIGLTQPTDRRGTRRWWARTGRRSGPACCEASKRIGFLKRSKSPPKVVAASLGIAIASSAEEAWAHMCKHEG